VGVLDGKVAIVTGAGRGIGRGEALLLAQEGARVVVNDVGTDGEAQQVVDEIVAAGGEAVTNADDVASWSGAEHLVGQAVDTWGKLDVLVNNAGILRDAMSFNMTEADWDAVINVHLKGHFAPCHFAARHWRDRGKAGDDVSGRIVNTVSESGLFGNAGQANYAAAKAGIASMTIVIARELKKYNVTANCVAPRARTRLTATVAGAEDYMAGPEWDPENIAPTVAFLASDAAADISGHVFVVWGPKLHLMTGWALETSLDRGEGRWTVDELVARKDELFATSSTKIPPMGFGL
jgi:NAD(P)-dependent dehydrogenase (short-subunit alcohol dehydrogenase family)